MTIRVVPSDESIAIIEFLKLKFDIPENSTKIVLTLEVDCPITVDVTYFPEFKDNGENRG
jgi:hypothetical protein